MPVRSIYAPLRAHWLGSVAAAFVLLLGLLTLAIPALLHNPDPNGISDALVLAPAPGSHVLGTDQLGRDVLLRLLFGIRVSLTVGVLATVMAVLFGGLVGSMAGFYGRSVDSGFMRISELFQTMPSFILAAVIVALAGPGLVRVIVVIALLAWPQAARVMRGQVLQVKQLEYVDAVRCLGIPEWRLLLSEVIPNAIGPVIALAPLIVSQAILLEAALSFLGLSSPGLVSWGGMLSDGQRLLFQAWWLSVFPGLAILLTVIAFNLMGDALNDIWNPRRAVAR